MRDAAGFQRPDITSGDVVTEGPKPPEQDRDMARRNWCGRTVLLDGPAAVMDQPVHERTDRRRKGLVDAVLREAAVIAVRARHRQSDHRRPLPNLGTRFVEWDISGLSRAAHGARERGIDERLDRGGRPEAGGQMQELRARS